MAIDPNGNFGFGGRVVDRACQNKKTGPKLGYGRDATVDVQLHANVGGVTVGFQVDLAHGSNGTL